jgi:predicted metalloprotease with PDZ domain
MALEWWKVVLSPQADNYATVTIAPSITLPAGWSSATALETSSTDGTTVTYKPVSLERLFDSPLDAGRYAKVLDLGTWDGAPLALAIFADVPSSLAVDAKTQDELRAIVAQMHALYVHRHFNHYTFLLTLTDVFGNGLEHHQSSDNGSSPDFFTSPTSLTAHASLLTHEFNHSWDGKYRRPAGLATPNLQVPMIDDLLWVYEGMTQYYGELVAERAGFRTAAQWRDQVAGTLAYYSNEPGRNTAPLEDTARASSIRRGFSAWSSERRSQDYYSEGLLIWLEADELIREHSGGKKSLDDFARAFFGDGADTAPLVKPYTRENLIAGLEKIDPYDWAAFFAKRVDAIAPLPPDVLAHGGYRLGFASKPSEFEKIQNGESKGVDAWYSLGFNVRAGALSDVRLDSPAGNAGLAPGDKLVAVNGRTFTGSQQLDTALTEAKDGSGISFIVSRDDAFMTVKIDYRGGPRYPYAERAPTEPDILNAIAKPLN